jgi:hypothetical protein
MKKTIIIFILLLSFGAFAQNKEENATKINSIALQSDRIIGQDQFGFSYFILNNVFHKMKDNKAFEYKNVSLGKITTVDIKNPLKILLYYENFNTVILLDNQLNEVQKINFSENGGSLVVSGIGIAAQNQLWIYNNLNQQIGLFDYLKNEYKSISTPLAGKIKKYQPDYNSFEWIDENNKWYSCDLFGKVTSKGTVPAFDQLVVIENNQIIYSKDYALYQFSRTKNEVRAIKILEKSFADFDYKDQILSIFTSEGIINYKITTP